ncbi:helix-turn-helix and ligand-binding sensor domain-containing protein [Mucilaginibacter ginsenosidivorax]|uniref:Transcriptional regulator n=1 Tax=Mucilaginibacter ginsenosidivorax TaxID=862126 RepID=A0A5B8W571_9SPHI|nr:triple tyrosine motif-containing protein [Mucilaginibacter ginsenosidivorax]QEC78577.1 transcriptional regulator [Mucilaginibacter ginsenosidivorax]
MKKRWLLFFLLLKFGLTYGQNPIGLPNIISYYRSDYNGGLQNRGIVQDKNGIIYFANSEGLLSFDGTYWKLNPLPNKTIIRSIALGENGRIYAGGQNEMGYFLPDKDGNLAFTSLKNLLPEKITSFKDIWDIVSFDDKMFFRSQNNIFQFDGKSITAYQPVSQWQFLGTCNNQLIAQDAKKGLFQFSNGEWAPLPINESMPQYLAVTGLLHLNKDSILINTLKKSLFILAHQTVSRFRFKDADPFLDQQIMCAMMMDNGHIAVGTHMGGLYIIDKQGRILQNFTRKEGLQNNTVLSLFLDKDRNLWMGLDNGIDFNAYNSAIKHIYPEKLNEGAGYSSILFDHTLYVGTSNWLYQLSVDGHADLSDINGTFKTVPGTKASAWGLFKVNDNLLLAHHEGAFQIKNKKAYPISTRFGYWNFTPYDKVLPSSTIVAGGYNGLDLIRYSNNAFVQDRSINFNESSRFVIVQNHTAWVAHTYKGIYKIALSLPGQSSAKLYNHHNGLPSDLKNRLFHIRNRMVVATEKGIYEYNAGTDRFEASTYFEPIFKNKALCYLKEDAGGNIWFIEEKKLGVVDFSAHKPRLIYFPELNGKLVSDFENIYPLNDENIFVGAEKGFYHINYRKYKANKSLIRVLLRQVRASGDADSVLNGGYRIAAFNSPDEKNTVKKLRIKQNTLHFEYSSPSFQKQSNIEYSCLLKNFDHEWSAWSRRTERDYTNLPEGTYTFQIKARSNLGDESDLTSYTFTILPPWYRTTWAYCIYGILLIVFNYLFYKWLKRKFLRQKQKYEEEQKRLKYLHQLEMEKSEKEIIALKNEKLESEILGKNSELASVALHLLQKSELLGKIREELVHLRKSSDDMPSEELKKMIRILNQESKMDKEWDQFAEYFDNTHSDFLKAVKEAHPLLSAHELKLCAYLRMNLSSKEIAQLMNISVRGVEISRYRLRKKLQVPTETNLGNYFSEMSSLKKDPIGQH